ncbi:MAG: potassium channel family protein [Bdellovibrionales bacterium]|nr:potassium channel family protein [Bdellovibrionales bacterium]
MRVISGLRKAAIRHQRSKNTSELLLLCVGLFAVLTLGTFGYMTIEGWSAFDALYMTVITLSTVGFSETHLLSQEGRLFTIILIVMGVGLVMAVLTTLARVIVDEQFHWIFERGGMEHAAKKFRDHTIFCGYGRLGRIAVDRLAESDSRLVVIDSDPEKVRAAIDEGHVAILGDAAQDEVLMSAGIERAARLVSLLPTDPDNLYVILSSKELNKDLYFF